MSQEQISIAYSVQEQSHREQAARSIKEGKVVGQFVRGVCILWIDAENRRAADRIYQIKGAKRAGRPFSILLETRSFISILDQEAIHPNLHRFFLDPDELEARLGALCMIRAPIQRKAVQKLPGYTYTRTEDGTYWLQSWVPRGHAPGRQLLEEMWSIGIRLPGVTSMNVSGEPEIVDQDEAVAFCEEHDISMFLQDQLDTGMVRGSFPIISIDLEGVHLVRSGHFPPYLFKYLLDGTEIDLSGARRSKYPIVNTHTEEAAQRMTAERIRKEILEMLDGPYAQSGSF